MTFVDDARWTLRQVNVATVADITTGKAGLTNASATVNSVTAAGVSADNFTDVTTDMWFRADADNVSYPISAVALGASPDTITLGTGHATGTRTYLGTTATAGSYRIFQDTYDLPTNIDEVKFIGYGDAGNWAQASRDARIEMVTMARLMSAAGGDLHRDTSGRPRLATLVANDASENQRLLMWPFPTEAHLIDIWAKDLISDNTTFATNLFSGDAPGIANVAVGHRLKMRASHWDANPDSASMWEERYKSAIAHLLRRENRDEVNSAYTVETGHNDELRTSV